MEPRTIHGRRAWLGAWRQRGLVHDPRYQALLRKLKLPA